jgi:hypothetical protein
MLNDNAKDNAFHHDPISNRISKVGHEPTVQLPNRNFSADVVINKGPLVHFDEIQVEKLESVSQ